MFCRGENMKTFNISDAKFQTQTTNKPFQLAAIDIL